MWAICLWGDLYVSRIKEVINTSVHTTISSWRKSDVSGWAEGERGGGGA